MTNKPLSASEVTELIVGLNRLARNLWWSWDHDSVGLFRDLDPVRWRQFNHNPLSVLGKMPLTEIERRAD